MSFELYEFRWRLIAAIVLVAGIAAHIIPYFANHDLWIDEAMLASSIVNRNFSNLIATPLDYGQSAPVGYLYMVKAITAVAGVSDFSLRVLSLISFGLVLYLMYQILRNVYFVKHYLFFLAVFSLLSFYVRYAVECKPYMLECVLVLLVVLLFNFYIFTSLQMIGKIGLEQHLQNIADVASDFRDKIKVLPVSLPKFPLSNAITPIIFDKPIAYKVFEILKDNYGIFVNPTGGKMADYSLRVAHIGQTSKEDNTMLVKMIEEAVKYV